MTADSKLRKKDEKKEKGNDIVGQQTEKKKLSADMEEHTNKFMHEVLCFFNTNLQGMYRFHHL